MRASLKSAENSAFSCVTFLEFLLSVASLPDLNSFLSLPSGMCDYFRFSISIFGVELFSSCLFFWVVCGLLGFWGGLHSLPHAPDDTYAHGPPFVMFYLRCRCASVIVYTTFCLFTFFTEVFLPLQSYWSRSFDHGLHCIVAMS